MWHLTHLLFSLAGKKTPSLAYFCVSPCKSQRFCWSVCGVKDTLVIQDYVGVSVLKGKDRGGAGIEFSHRRMQISSRSDHVVLQLELVLITRHGELWETNQTSSNIIKHQHGLQNTPLYLIYNTHLWSFLAGFSAPCTWWRFRWAGRRRRRDSGGCSPESAVAPQQLLHAVQHGEHQGNIIWLFIALYQTLVHLFAIQTYTDAELKY